MTSTNNSVVCMNKIRGKYQIVFVAAEVSPWSRTGGLGEVMGGLPIALAKLGHRVMTVSPRWDQYADAWDTGVVITLTIGQMTTQVRYFHTYQENVDRIFVDHPLFLERVWGCTEQRYYGPTWGQDWSDNQLVMTLFNHAALAAIDSVPLGGYPYGCNVTIICNDWHTCVLPHLIAERQKNNPGSEYCKTRTCLVIHNLVFQGRFPDTGMAQSTLGFTSAMMKSMEAYQPTKPGCEDEPSSRTLNWLQGALSCVDQLITVSPTYGKEVETDPEKGTELCTKISEHPGKAKNGILGILNGLTPQKEHLCYQPYETVRKIKEQKKTFLQSQHKLPMASDVPLIAFIGRLDYQKGVDILIEMLRESSTKKCQFLIVGFGQTSFENALQQICQTSTNVACDIQCKGSDKYDIYYGTDFILLPSRYEPCGLVQMEAMSCGAVPITTPTGGFIDTITPDTGLFTARCMTSKSCVVPEDVQNLSDAVDAACQLYQNKPKYQQTQSAALELSKSYTWEAAAKQYENVLTCVGSCPIQSPDM